MCFCPKVIVLNVNTDRLKGFNVLCVENGLNWEANFPYALLALRTVMYNSTGFSLAELVHSKNLRTPEMLLVFEKWVGKRRTINS